MRRSTAFAGAHKPAEGGLCWSWSKRPGLAAIRLLGASAKFWNNGISMGPREAPATRKVQRLFARSDSPPVSQGEFNRRPVPFHCIGLAKRAAPLINEGL